jgi:hypothetical protein
VSRVKPSGKRRRKRRRLVELDQVPRLLDDPKLRSGNELDQTMGAVDGNPGVFASPDDEDRQVELRVQGLDLVRYAWSACAIWR